MKFNMEYVKQVVSTVTSDTGLKNLIIEKCQRYNDTPVITVAAFDEADRASMIEHLATHHNWSSQGRTKVTMAALKEVHAALHSLDEVEGGMSIQINYLDREDLESEDRWTGVTAVKPGERRMWAIPPIRHDHQVALDLQSIDTRLGDTSGVAGEADANKPLGDKPLSASEAKVLRGVLDNDFASLANQMKALARDAIDSKRREINAEWDEREGSLPDFAGEANATAAKHREETAQLAEKQRVEREKLTDQQSAEIEAVTESAKVAGITLTCTTVTADGTQRRVYSGTIAGRNDAIKEAERQINDDLQRALLTVETQRLVANRRVLISQIGADGAKVLESIPKAADLMVDAQREGSMKEIATS